MSEDNNRTAVSFTHMEPDHGYAAFSTNDTPAFDSLVSIRVISYRKFKHDPEGVSVKAVLDGLVHAGILTDAGYKNLQAQGSVDGVNAQIYNRIDAANKNQKEKEIRSINAKGALKLASEAAAEKGRIDRATTNFALEDFQIDKNNNPYKRYNPKDPNPTKPGQTRMQMYADYVEEFGKDDPNIGRLADADYKEQAGSAKYGGFIPRYNTMPYGN